MPGVHVGLEGYLRVWLGGREPFLREGLRRIGEELGKLALLLTTPPLVRI